MANQDGEKYHVEKLDRKLMNIQINAKKKTKKKTGKQQ